MKPKKGTWCLGVINYADSHTLSLGERQSLIFQPRDRLCRKRWCPVSFCGFRYQGQKFMRCKCGHKFSAPISGSFLDFDVLRKATHCRIKIIPWRSRWRAWFLNIGEAGRGKSTVITRSVDNSKRQQLLGCLLYWNYVCSVQKNTFPGSPKQVTLDSFLRLSMKDISMKL